MNKKSKKLMFLSTLGIVLTPVVFVSCGVITPKEEDNNDKTGNVNNNNNQKNQDTSTQPKFLISEYFDNLAIKNESNLTIEDWIKNFHMDLGVDINKPVSFNRSSDTEVISNADYVNKSYKLIEDVANQKYLVNSKKNYFNGFGYDIRATKLADNLIRISVYIYNPNLETANIINQNFDLPFVYINPTKEYERLVAPLQSASDQLEELKPIKDNPTIKSDYDKLMNIWGQANILVARKINDVAQITQVLEALNSAINGLNTAKNILSTMQNLASLQVEVTKQNSLLEANAENEKISFINRQANEFRTLILRAENYIKAGVSNVEQTEKLKNDLMQASRQYQDAINNLPRRLNNFIQQFSSNIIINGVQSNSSRILQILPSQLQTSNLDIRSTAQLQDAEITFMITPHDSFGVVYIGANIKYGSLNRTIAPMRYNQVFLSKAQLSQFFTSTFYQMPCELVINKKWPGGDESLKTAMSSTSTILEKLNEILDETKTESDVNNQPVKSDRVATFLWALEYSISNNKEDSLKKVKDSFLNKPNSTTFSKLQYLTQTTSMENGKQRNYWDAFMKFAELITYANLVTSKDPNFTMLQAYRGTNLITFIQGWWRIYFTRYYNSSTTPTNNQWALFEFTQLYRTIKLYLVLQNHLRDPATFFETIKHYAASISEYGRVRNSTSNLNGLIDNPKFAQFAFAARLYWVFNERNLDLTIKDAADYKNWLENVNYTNLFKDLKNNPTEFLKYLVTLKNQNEVYEILKQNGSDFGLNFTNFNALQTWFFTNYVNTEITFEKLNGDQGQNYMSIVAALYSVMKINPNAQKEFVNKLKESILLKGKQKTEFTKLSTLSNEDKMIWETIFLA